MLKDLGSLPANHLISGEVPAFCALVATFSEPVDHVGLDILTDAVLLLSNSASWPSSSGLIVLLDILWNDICVSKDSAGMSRASVTDVGVSRDALLLRSVWLLEVEPVVSRLRNWSEAAKSSGRELVIQVPVVRERGGVHIVGRHVII